MLKALRDFLLRRKTDEPPPQLWPGGIMHGSPIPASREVTNATHRGWRAWNARDHIAERQGRRMVTNTDYLKQGAHVPDTDARTGRIDWRD